MIRECRLRVDIGSTQELAPYSAFDPKRKYENGSLVFPAGYV